MYSTKLVVEPTLRHTCQVAKFELLAVQVEAGRVFLGRGRPAPSLVYNLILKGKA